MMKNIQVIQKDGQALAKIALTMTSNTRMGSPQGTAEK